jgi:hypothetical protein
MISSINLVKMSCLIVLPIRRRLVNLLRHLILCSRVLRDRSRHQLSCRKTGECLKPERVIDICYFLWGRLWLYKNVSKFTYIRNWRRIVSKKLIMKTYLCGVKWWTTSKLSGQLFVLRNVLKFISTHYLFMNFNVFQWISFCREKILNWQEF